MPKNFISLDGFLPEPETAVAEKFSSEAYKRVTLINRRLIWCNFFKWK